MFYDSLLCNLSLFMSKLFSFFVLFTLSLVMIGAGCTQSKTSESQMSPQATSDEEVSVLADGNYALNTQESILAWESGKKLIPNYTHNGTVGIKSGEVVVQDAGVTEGTFVIDMNEIVVLDGAGENLLKHLQSDDFFFVTTYPEGTLVITNVVKNESMNDYRVTADLTLKGKTNEIVFDAKITQENDQVFAQAEFDIDRTLWDVRYGSDSFFDDLGDNVIKDEINITLNLVADKIN